MVSLFTGCGKTTEDSIVNQVASGSKDYVFSIQAIDIPNQDTSELNRLWYLNNKVYASGYGYNGNINIYSFNPDGTDLESISLNIPANENFQQVAMDADENIYAFSRSTERNTIYVLVNFTLSEVTYQANFLKNSNSIFGNYESNEKGILRPLEAVIYEEEI